MAGFVVAPLLFQNMLPSVAGNIAGQLFSIISYLGLFCCSFLLLGQLVNPCAKRFNNFRVWSLIAMLVIIVIGEFVIRPMMVDLKQGGLVAGSQDAIDFGRLHGVSSMLYMINSVLCLVLVAFGLRQTR